jgi:hypothetical protein
LSRVSPAWRALPQALAAEDIASSGRAVAAKPCTGLHQSVHPPKPLRAAGLSRVSPAWRAS